MRPELPPVLLSILLFFLLVAVRTPHAEYYALFLAGGGHGYLTILAVVIANLKS